MAFGIVLARLRHARGWSQEELAHKSGLSQRHVSFLETGRSQPGSSALAKLTGAMALKGWEQRSLMASLAPEKDREAPTPNASTLPKDFLERLSHCPGCVFTPDGTLVQTNRALDALLDYAGESNDLWAVTAQGASPNLYDLTLHPNGLVRWMENPEVVVPETIRRLRIEALQTPELGDALSRFESYPSVQQYGTGLADPPALLSERYRMPNGETLTVISVLSSIASPGEYDLATLRIETFVPADDASAAIIRSLAPPATARAI
ncbi:MAG: helix-turn-helix domain-containing protein [Pseudomonadota bacterium]